MSRRLPALGASKILSALHRGGFRVHHVRGSHDVLKHPDRPEVRVVVPFHSRDLPAGTVRAIIRQAGLGVDAFLDLL